MRIHFTAQGQFELLEFNTEHVDELIPRDMFQSDHRVLVDVPASRVNEFGIPLGSMRCLEVILFCNYFLIKSHEQLFLMNNITIVLYIVIALITLRRIKCFPHLHLKWFSGQRARLQSNDPCTNPSDVYKFDGLTRNQLN